MGDGFDGSSFKSLGNNTFSNFTISENGGVFYVGDADNNSIYLNSDKFNNNKSDKKGGAIAYLGDYLNIADLNILDVSDTLFDTNKSNYGGAIHNSSSIFNITAQNKQVLFDGNTDSNGSNAIFNYAEYGEATINLNANSGNNIVFNDKIDGNENVVDKQIININKANVGANSGNANTMYGKEVFTTLATGIASKTGYNWELGDGKFIIQPNFLISYTFVDTFDYTNAAGIRISSDPLNSILIAPGVKFIGNLKNGWQPYLGVQMVWNIMDRTKFNANNVELPNMSVDPYIQYGVGVQKKIGDRQDLDKR